MNNLTFCWYGFTQRPWNLVMCHFTHTSFFSYALDSFITFWIAQNLGQLLGNKFVAKTMLLSIMCGSTALLLHHATNVVDKPYYGSDAILRGLIFALMFK